MEREFSHYRIVDKLGQGGMGEVYRAFDTILKREVALKVLPRRFIQSPHRLRRFQREAQSLASLNHPNIAAIYGLEESQDVPFLVLELVEGETLDAKLGRGPLPLKSTLELALQIVDGLEAAHRRGIIHRDLKPSNIKITGDERVKLLDFGLAKMSQWRSGDDTDPRATTESLDLTAPGSILGTPAYMSPEQLRGQAEVGPQADVWAFGCVLYEMLAGKKAFSGPSLSDVIAGVIECEPEWEELPALPSQLGRLLRRCLQKDLRDRLHDIADVRIELEEILAEDLTDLVDRERTLHPSGRRHWLWALPASLLLLVAGALLGEWFRPGDRPPVGRFEIDLQSSQGLAYGADLPPSLVLSPDGTQLVFASLEQGANQLYLRSLDRFQIAPIPGTRGGESPFFSPDGKWLGFFADGKLKKVPLTGGAVTTLCDAPRGWGGTWGPDNTIVFSRSSSSGLWWVSAEGGEPASLAAPDPQKGEQGYDSPHFLPDGRSILFNIWTGGSYSDARIAILSLDDPHPRVLLEGGNCPVYLPSGQIVYARGPHLFAVHYDLKTRQVTDTPRPLLQGIQTTPYLGMAIFSLSPNGTLVYAPGEESRADSRLVWVDPAGRIEPISQERRPYGRPRFSPDGLRIVFHAVASNFELWSYDLARGVFSRLTSHPGWDGFGVWRPGGDQIAFASARTGVTTLFSTNLGGRNEVQQLMRTDIPRWPTSWSPDGKILAYHEQSASTGYDIGLLDVEQSSSRVWLNTPFDEARPMFSPDGKWIAYQSNETGRWEIYLQPYPGPGERRTVSIRGGMWPFWSHRHPWLYYLEDSRVMKVHLDGSGYGVSPPEFLFDAGKLQINDVAVDDERFLALEEPELSPVTRLHVVLNWETEIERPQP